MDSAIAKLLKLIRAALYMIRKGLSKQKLGMELHLLFKRGKLAGKAIGNLLASQGHGSRTVGCRPMDLGRSFHSPREVEFSCTSTPSYPASLFFPSAGKRKTRRRQEADPAWDGLDVDAVAKQLERMSLEVASSRAESPAPYEVLRQLRITDSPLPLREEDGEADGGRVDREAEEFIKRFYEQQRLQRSVPATPESQCRRREQAP